MDYQILTWISSDNGLLVYLAVFVLLILGGLGFPIPEDVPLALAGAAAARGIVPLQGIFLISYIGVVAADQIVFFFGYFCGEKLLTAGTKSRFFSSITEDRVNEVREGLRKRRLLYILIGRHLFPVRSVTFLAAGTLRIPFWEFFFSDALAALISVPLVVGFGYYLGSSLSPEVVSHLLHKAHYYIAALAVLLLMIYAGRAALSRKRPPRANALDESKIEPQAKVEIRQGGV